MNRTPKPAWNPYIAGALTGLAAIAAVYLSGEYFGAQPGYLQCVEPLHYYILNQTHAFPAMAQPLRPDVTPGWHVMFVPGIFLGALLAAVLYRDFKWQGVPKTWRMRFGPSAWKRSAVAFAGGFIAMLGVRLAGGCPSGLGMSGMMQLSLGGFIGMMMFFAGGIVMTRVLFGWRGDSSRGGR